MKVLWLGTTSMSLEPIIRSIDTISGVTETTRMDYFEMEDQVHAISFVIEQRKPDLILYIGTLDPRRLSIEHLLSIKEKAPLVMICCDAGCPDWWPLLIEYKEKGVFTFIVNIDGSTEWPESEWDLTTLCPIDTRFYDEKVVKDIVLGFAGGCGGGKRKELTDELKKRGLLVVAPRNENYGTYQDYANFLKRCHFVINMCETGSGRGKHVKARVVETALAGACLLEPKDSITELWFQKGIQYLEYDSIDDIERIVVSMSLKEAKSYSERMYSDVMSYHSPERFWDSVFHQVKVMK